MPLVIYPGQGDQISDREHRRDSMNCLTAPFDDHLKPKPMEKNSRSIVHRA
jgi:hypothetical protein